jgi:transposase
MSLWDRIVAVFKSEAADVKEGLSKVGASLDAELERKQRELDAEPHERVDMILEDIKAADSRFEELETRLRREAGDDTPGA